MIDEISLDYDMPQKPEMPFVRKKEKNKETSVSHSENETVEFDDMSSGVSDNLDNSSEGASTYKAEVDNGEKYDHI